MGQRQKRVVALAFWLPGFHSISSGPQHTWWLQRVYYGYDGCHWRLCSMFHYRKHTPSKQEPLDNGIIRCFSKICAWLETAVWMSVAAET